MAENNEFNNENKYGKKFSSQFSENSPEKYYDIIIKYLKYYDIIIDSISMNILFQNG